MKYKTTVTPNAGKGHNVTFKIVNPLVHTMSATDVFDGHVPENGGT
jgi:hypothetical protein